jgi:hypothetical protein
MLLVPQNGQTVSTASLALPARYPAAPPTPAPTAPPAGPRGLPSVAPISAPFAAPSFACSFPRNGGGVKSGMVGRYRASGQKRSADWRSVVGKEHQRPAIPPAHSSKASKTGPTVATRPPDAPRPDQPSAVRSRSIRPNARRQTGTYGAAQRGTSNPIRQPPPTSTDSTRCPVAPTPATRQVHRRSRQVSTRNGTRSPPTVRTCPSVPTSIKRSSHSTPVTDGPHSSHLVVSVNSSQAALGGASTRRDTRRRRPSGVRTVPIEWRRLTVEHGARIRKNCPGPVS